MLENVDTGEALLDIETERQITADRSRLKQLVENLFRNAIEHGSERVTVTVGNLDKGFFVEEIGVGIPEDQQDDVFMPGYSTAENGTGFGLSIVKQIADAQEWGIRVSDSSEGGEWFEFTGVESAD